ncbi:hypothetical protein NIES22_50940 [Calothrix brevissima NIES-22]|nr:hypothetical protein NIES22_50940 [Calothrix brevissima NIES-22]
MSQILGTLLDSGGNPITGKLRVTLSGNLIEVSANPDSIYLTQPSVFTITNGVVDINLDESETKKITYRFEFFKADGEGNLIEPALLDFYALVPNSTPVQLANLVPTGMVNDVLDTGALRIAQLIASDTNLSANIGGPFPRGNWSSEVTYKYRDLVNYLNRTYISRSILPITGILPTNDTYWMRIPVEVNGSLILGSDVPYGVSWSGSGLATSQDAVYNKIQSIINDLSLKANIISPTFSGVVNFNNTLKTKPGSTNIPGLDIQTASGARSTIRFSDTNGLTRWEIFKSEVAESGSNAGSNLTINSYDDSGNLIGWCMDINRASRAVNVPNPSAGDNSTRVANTSWVTNKLTSYATLNSPSFTGVATSTTPSDPFDNSARIATTQHVRNILSYYAPTYSPVFQGTPTFNGVTNFNSSTVINNTLTVNPSGIFTPGVNIQSSSGNRSCIRFSSNTGANRWEIFKNEAAEAGSNSGSNFVINRYDDSGNYLDYAFSIDRYNGKVTLNGNTTVNGKLNCNSLGTVLATDLANSGVAGNPGDIVISATYLYICVASNSWKRVALSSF